MTAATATGYVPTSPPDLGFLDAFEDGGRWRETVTHWHLTLNEIATGDPSRFTRERVEQIQLRDYHGATADPREALVWLTEQRAAALARSTDPAAFARRKGWHTRADWEFSAATSWFVLTTCPTTPAGGGLAIRDGWTVEMYAVPMTAYLCGKRH